MIIVYVYDDKQSYYVLQTKVNKTENSFFLAF